MEMRWGWKGKGAGMRKLSLFSHPAGHAELLGLAPDRKLLSSRV